MHLNNIDSECFCTEFDMKRKLTPWNDYSIDEHHYDEFQHMLMVVRTKHLPLARTRAADS